MRVIMFQERFAVLVANGSKTQTIRKTARCKPGDTLSLRRWTGKPYRSKQETLRVVTCSAVRSIVIGEPCPDFNFNVDGKRLDQPEWAALARADGFDCTSQMLTWFRETHGLPFHGQIIEWSNSASGTMIDALGEAKARA